MPEEWRPFPGYEGSHQVSSLGRVRSRRCILKPSKDWKGYTVVCMSLSGKQNKVYVAKSVLEAFIGPRPDGMIACHGPNGIEDNSVENLYWGTYSKNLGEDKVRDGTSNRGSMNGMSRLSEIDVRFIKFWIRKGYKCVDIAKKFLVSRQIVTDIKFGRRWAWM